MAYSKEAAAAATRRWRARHPERAYMVRRKSGLKQMYGITYDEYEDMLAKQNGKCAICDNPPTGKGRMGRHLYVDHCHDKKHIRGLLCGKCNVALGCFDDDPARMVNAINYIT